MANFNLAYDYRNEHFRTTAIVSKMFNLSYQQHKLSGYISQFHLLNFSTKFGASYTNTTFDLSSITGNIYDSIIFVSNKLVTPFVNLEFDNLDDSYFAKHGVKASLSGRYHFDLSHLAEDEFDTPSGYFDVTYNLQSYITPGGGRFTIIPQVYGRYVSGLPGYFNLWNVYGSEISGRHFSDQMPFIGFGSVETADDNASVFRADLRYNLYRNHYLTAMYNLLINWDMVPVMQFDDSINPIEAQGAGLKYSYNSPLGPISLTAHWSRRSEQNRFGAYFSFGYTF